MNIYSDNLDAKKAPLRELQLVEKGRQAAAFFAYLAQKCGII